MIDEIISVIFGVVFVSYWLIMVSDEVWCQYHQWKHNRLEKILINNFKKNLEGLK